MYIAHTLLQAHLSSMYITAGPIACITACMSLQADLTPEEWGGETPFVNISAKKGEGIGELLEMVALVAELEEFVANPDRAAQGTVLESHLDKHRGPVASLLVQAGTLRVRRRSACCWHRHTILFVGHIRVCNDCCTCFTLSDS